MLLLYQIVVLLWFINWSSSSSSSGSGSGGGGYGVVVVVLVILVVVSLYWSSSSYFCNQQNLLNTTKPFLQCGSCSVRICTI